MDQTSVLLQRSLRGFSQEVVEELSGLKGEPNWMRQRRLEAWHVYQATPMPTTQDEYWRRTDLSRLPLDQLIPFAEAPAQAATPQGLPRELAAAMGGGQEAGLLVQHDSQAVYQALAPEAAQKGVIFTDMDRALREHPQLVRQHFMTTALTPHHGKFTALGGALWSGGAFLYVPQGVEVVLPIRSALWLATPSLAVFPHTLVVAEAGAKVSFIEEHLSPPLAGAAFNGGAVEVVLGEGAQCYYVNVQQMDTAVANIVAQRMLMGPASSLDYLAIALGGGLSKAFVEAELVGDGARACMLGVVFGDGDQHFDFQSLQDHVGPHTASDLLFKVALKGRAMSVFMGNVKVRTGARRTDASQTIRNLLLSDQAKAHPIPMLEIEASDIRRCSHATAVGQVDEAQLFYLMTRGLSRQEAERLIIDGFFEPVIEQIPLPQVQQRLRQAIGRKLAYS
ncbi:MAG: Fe-S cluster assembly protein SufD [Dehalococcoidia bacterium]